MRNELKVLTELIGNGSATKVYSVVENLGSGKIRLESNSEMIVASGNYSVGSRVLVNNGIISGEIANSKKIYEV